MPDNAYLTRNPLEKAAYTYYTGKRVDPINLDLGAYDGYYHHHYAVGDYDHSVLEAPPDKREDKIAEELHRMETRQVGIITSALSELSPSSRVLDGGSGRGGTSFLLHDTLGCEVDGVNIVSHHNEFARTQAGKRGVARQVRFHDRNMSVTGFHDASFDAVVTNETTMYVDPHETFREFARLLIPGGRYILVTWCKNSTDGSVPAEATGIDEHYHCHTHHRATYLSALVAVGLIPYQIDDLTAEALPYWELRTQSKLATGVEPHFLHGYRNGHINYTRICTRKTLGSTT